MAREEKPCEKKDAWHEYLDSMTFWERIDFDDVFMAAASLAMAACGVMLLALCLYILTHLFA